MNLFILGELELLRRAREASGGSSVSTGTLLERIVDTLIFIIGIVAVIALIIGGLRYILSGGNPQAAKGAKDTILYALIGVAVAVAAYAMVNFVIGKL